MSEAFGPRAHPERCERPPRRSYEESLGTAFGVLMLALILAGAILWWVL